MYYTEVKEESLLSIVSHLSSREIPSLADLFSLSLSLSGWKIARGSIWSTQSLICPLSKQPIRGQTEVASQPTQIFISSIKGLRRSDKTIERNFSATELDSRHYPGTSINPHRSTFRQLSCFVYNKLFINPRFFSSFRFVSVPLSVLWRWSYLSSLHLLCSAWFCCRTSHNRAAWVFASPPVRSQTPAAQNTTGSR